MGSKKVLRYFLSSRTLGFDAGGIPIKEGEWTKAHSLIRNKREEALGRPASHPPVKTLCQKNGRRG